MQQQNQPPRNNPWGFQAMNWSHPNSSRGPPPQHIRPDMNRFGSPPGPRSMMRPNFGHNIRPQNPGPLFTQSRLPNNQGMSFNGPQNQNTSPQGPGQAWQQGPQNNQNQRHRHPGPRFNQGLMCNRPHRPQNNHGHMGNRPPTRPMVGPPPEFFRAPGGFQQRPRFHSGRQHGEKKKKANKRDLPENNKFYCDTCDKGYKDEDKYKLHCDQHEKCPKEGCAYIAAGKLVQLHVKLQHNSGMAKKIWSLESKEDIQKWINERKKNFPTTANVEKKKALLAEKVARGEVIEEKYFGKMHRREDDRRNGRNRGRGRGQRGQTRQNLKRQHDDTEKSECTAEKQSKENTGDQNVRQEAAESLGMFFAAASSSGQGHTKIVHGHTKIVLGHTKGIFFADKSEGDTNTSSSDDDDDNDKVKQSTGNPVSTVPDVTAAGALGSLMSSYVDADDSEEEKTDKNKGTAKTPEKDSKSESVEDRTDQNRYGKKTPRNRERGRQRKNKSKWAPPPKLDKSLLEKLLAKEMRQERNKIMQCVHYIVKNNFFDTVTNEENKP